MLENDERGLPVVVLQDLPRLKIDNVKFDLQLTAMTAGNMHVAGKRLKYVLGSLRFRFAGTRCCLYEG